MKRNQNWIEPVLDKPEINWLGYHKLSVHQIKVNKNNLIKFKPGETRKSSRFRFAFYPKKRISLSRESREIMFNLQIEFFSRRFRNIWFSRLPFKDCFVHKKKTLKGSKKCGNFLYWQYFSCVNDFRKVTVRRIEFEEDSEAPDWLEVLFFIANQEPRNLLYRQYVLVSTISEKWL